MRYLLSDLRIFLTLILISLLCFGLDFSGLLQIPKSALQTLTVPVQYGLYKFSSSFTRQAGFVFAVRHISQENRALKQQLGEIMTENAQLRQKLSDTQSLVEQDRSLPPSTYDLLPARVIGIGRFLTIDKGSNEGVKVNSVVVYKDNFVGLVKSVNPKTSQVLLPFDPDSKLASFSQNIDGKAKGIVIGQFGSQLLMDKILHQEPIKENDLVYSEGTEGNLPRGLIIGKVSKVDERQNEVFKQAEVQTLFDVNNLDLVFVIKE